MVAPYYDFKTKCERVAVATNIGAHVLDSGRDQPAVTTTGAHSGAQLSIIQRHST